jgi:hypothetical protein
VVCRTTTGHGTASHDPAPGFAARRRRGAAGDHALQAYGSSEADYSTDVLRELTREFIVSSVATGQPFYLQLNFKAPHTPREPAPRHVDAFAGLSPWRPPNYNEADVSDKPTWLRNVPLLTPARQADTDDLRQRQLEMLFAVDEAIGGSTTHGITGLISGTRVPGSGASGLITAIVEAIGTIETDLKATLAVGALRGLLVDATA